MKLSFLIYTYFPFGGLQRDFFRIIEECSQRGHDIDVYTFSWQGDIPAGVNVVLVPELSRNRIKRNKAFSKWVQEALDGQERSLVIGFNKMPNLDIYFAADPCFLEKADKQRGLYYKFTPRYRHFKEYEASVFAKDEKTEILILSPQQRIAFETYYPGCGYRLTTIPPGISVDRKVEEIDSDVAAILREELQIKTDEKLILQIGSGFRVKGVDRSLRAIASLPVALRERCRYVLIGQDKPNRFLALAKKLGIRENFMVLPGRDDIPRFLAAADLLLHPAYAESAGYVLLEATIAGLPVLTTATCGYAFHIEKAASGEVCKEPFQQQELNTRLQNMLESLATASWSGNGLKYGKQEELYSQSTAVADFIEQHIARIS
jgi:UDP-glucose:(heptosyl)LPS alpha-1,3-glucosyltransferase